MRDDGDRGCGVVHGGGTGGAIGGGRRSPVRVWDRWTALPALLRPRRGQRSQPLRRTTGNFAQIRPMPQVSPAEASARAISTAA